jgi:hypothetical protein
MLRKNCPIEKLARELDHEQKVATPHMCQICASITDNTVIARQGSISIDFIEQCSKVRICIADVCHHMSADEFFELKDQICKRVK